MVALEMVVLDELRDREPEVALTEGNELVEDSDLRESTNLSATAFGLGLRGGSLRHSMPVARRTARIRSVNSGARS
jgi:hypothetical protein